MQRQFKTDAFRLRFNRTNFSVKTDPVGETPRLRARRQPQ